MWQNNYKNPKFLSIEKRAFGWVGIDIEAPEGSRIVKNPAWLSLLFVLNALWLISFCRNVIENISEVDEIADTNKLLLSIVLAMLKMLLVLTKRRTFVRLIRDLKDHTRLENSKERKIWSTKNERSFLIVHMYERLMYAALCLTVFTPPLMALETYIRTGQLILNSPVAAWYPYDESRPFWFIFTELMLLPFTIFCCNWYLGVDSLFCWYIHNVTAHFGILTSKLEYVASDLVDGCTLLQFKQSMRKVVAYHHRTIDLVQKFNLVFREIIFSVVLINSVHTCVFTYQLSNTSDYVDIPVIVIAFLTVCAQLVIYCLGGEMLQTESETLSNNIYLLFPWDRMSPAMRRELLLPLLRAQKASTINGYFFVANHELLLWLFKTTYSFTALLSAMQNENIEVQ